MDNSTKHQEEEYLPPQVQFQRIMARHTKFAYMRKLAKIGVFLGEHHE